MTNKSKVNPIEYYTKRNWFLKILFKQLEPKGITTTEQFLEIMNTNEATFFAERKGFPLDKNKPQAWHPVRIDTIRKLYLPFGIDCEKFLLPKDIEDAFFLIPSRNKEKHLYFTHKYWDNIKSYKPHYSLVEVIPFSTDTSRNKELLAAYDKIAPYISEAKVSITVYELLFKGDNFRPGNMFAYIEAQKKIFTATKDALKTNKDNRGFLYKRILSLSSSQNFFPKNGRDTLKVAMVAEASQETLAHILWCWKHYPNKCKFEITQAARFRHHASVDDKWFFSEDYVIDQNGVIIPDCLYINDVHRPSPIDALKKLYEQHTKNQKRIPLREGDIKRFLKRAIEHIENEMESKTNIIDVLKKYNLKEKEDLPDIIQELIDQENDALDTLGVLLKNLNSKQSSLENLN